MKKILTGLASGAIAVLYIIKPEAITLILGVGITTFVVSLFLFKKSGASIYLTDLTMLFATFMQIKQM